MRRARHRRARVVSATRETFGDAIAALPNYRRQQAWQYVGKLESLVRVIAFTRYREEMMNALTPEERDLLRRVEALVE